VSPTLPPPPPPPPFSYGDVTPNTTPEIIYTIVYVAINVVVWAYILGTITLLVTKQVRTQAGLRVAG